ncbi:MAG: L,D-transpeptidase [Chloroflexi bacterium]|nr:L,D-transpeptidase [Chloroflexota bacterium]
MHYQGISRRTALKAGALTAASLIAGRGVPRALAQQGAGEGDDEQLANPGGRVRVQYDELQSFNELYDYPPLLGRAETWRISIVEDPGRYNETVVRLVNYSDVVPIYGAIRHEALRWGYEHNDVWFDVGEGYIHSSWIVPCYEIFNEPEEVIGDGFWGEITVPTSWQHWEPKLKSTRYYDFAYGAVFRVLDRKDEENGRAWYKLFDDAKPGASWWVQATHVRRIDEREFAPISPDVPPEEKRIEVDLDNQVVTCFEYDHPVFSARCATGTAFRDEEGRRLEFFTPRGEFRVWHKRPSRRMTGGESANDRYDLPGVPWCTFFTASGVGFHGTYWHNDYGKPRSHGCVNLTPEAAKWIYRWIEPYTGHDVEAFFVKEPEEREIATRITVF